MKKIMTLSLVLGLMIVTSAVAQDGKKDAPKPKIEQKACCKDKKNAKACDKKDTKTCDKKDTKTCDKKDAKTCCKAKKDQKK